MCYNVTAMFPPAARAYIAAALDNTPATLTALVSSLAVDSPVWDTRPEPDRFSLREIVAHLADWDAVWRERFERTRNEDHPLLLRPVPDERAQEQGYAHADPAECLARFQESRTALTGWLRALTDDEGNLIAHLDRLGDIPLEGLAALALGHDSYHLRQTAEWLAAAAKP